MDDIQGEARRAMLSSLVTTSQTVLAFLSDTIERYWPTRDHNPVDAAFMAIETFADWVPVRRLEESGAIAKVGSVKLPESGLVPLGAVQVLRQIVMRKKGEENAQIFNAVLQQVAAILLSQAALLLSPSHVQYLNFENEWGEETAPLLVEALATLGAEHLAAIPPGDVRNNYLQLMLSFAQVDNLLLAEKALTFWAKLLQEISKEISHQHQQQQQQHLLPHSLPPEAIAALMNLATEQLMMPRVAIPQQQENDDQDIPVYFHDFIDYREFIVLYRSRLSTILRAAASVLPEQALAGAKTRLHAALTAAGGGGTVAGGGGAVPEQVKPLMDTAVFLLEAVMKAVWDDKLQNNPARLETVSALVEPMLQELLVFKTTHPPLLQSQGQGLAAFAKLCTVRTHLIPDIITRLLELLATSIPLQGDARSPPPPNPPPTWREVLHARQSIAAVIVAYTKAAPTAFLPHLESLATQSQQLWDGGLIRPGEHNAIKEGIVTAATSNEGMKASVLEFVLGPVRGEWLSEGFQASLASPEIFIKTFIKPTQNDGAGNVVGTGTTTGGHARWLLYHQIHLIEKAVRVQHPGSGSGSGSGSRSALSSSRALAVHLEWAVPVMLQIVSLVHAVFTPQGRAAVGPPLDAALSMSPQEKAFYLKRPTTSAPISSSSKVRSGSRDSSASANPPSNITTTASQQQQDGGDYSSVGDSSIAGLRAWLRHVREFIYCTLGMLAHQCPAALDSPSIHAVFSSKLFSYLDTLDHQHVRIMMRHVFLPFIRACPVRHLDSWVVKSMAVLAPRVHTRLTSAWGALSHLQHQQQQNGTGTGTDDEIIQETVVRELSGEYADILKDFCIRTCEKEEEEGSNGSTTTTTTTTAQSLSPPGPAKPLPPLPVSLANPKSSKTLLEYTLGADPATGFVMATTAVEGMTWPDDSAFKYSIFGRALVSLAPKDPSLKDYVGSQVLTAAIKSLTLTVMAPRQADVLTLIREILVQQWDIGTAGGGGGGGGGGFMASPASRVLLSLPNMDEAGLKEFRERLGGLSGEKAQRDAVKKMLQQAMGAGTLTALADMKGPSGLSLSEPTVRARRNKSANEQAEGEQLQGEAYRLLFSH